MDHTTGISPPGAQQSLCGRGQQARQDGLGDHGKRGNLSASRVTKTNSDLTERHTDTQLIQRKVTLSNDCKR